MGLKGALALPRQVANEPPPAPCFSPGDFAKARARGGVFFGGEFDRTFSVHFCSWCLCTSFYRLIVKHGSHENRRVERKIIINHHLKTPNEIK